MRCAFRAGAAFARRSGSCAFSVPNRPTLVTIISVRPIMALSNSRNTAGMTEDGVRQGRLIAFVRYFWPALERERTIVNAAHKLKAGS